MLFGKIVLETINGVQARGEVLHWKQGLPEHRGGSPGEKRRREWHSPLLAPATTQWKPSLYSKQMTEDFSGDNEQSREKAFRYGHYGPPSLKKC